MFIDLMMTYTDVIYTIYQYSSLTPHFSFSLLCLPSLSLSVIHLGDRDVPNALVFIDKYVNVEPRNMQPPSHTHETCNLQELHSKSKSARNLHNTNTYTGLYMPPPTSFLPSRYTQVSRILHPICRAIDGIDDLMADPGLRDFVTSTFGSADACKKVQKTERRGDIESERDAERERERESVCVCALVFSVVRIVTPHQHSPQTLPTNTHAHTRTRTVLRKSILADFFTHGFDGSGSDGGSCIDGRLTSAYVEESLSY